MRNMPRLALFLAVATITMIAPPSLRAGEGPRRPPPAAFDACSGKSAGEACQVALPDRTVDGTCAATPDGALACRPDHPPGPPPEMAAACRDKSDGDPCSFSHDGRAEEGVCRRGRAGALVCLP